MLQVRHECLSFVVIGATGNLAQVKLLPAIFNLHAQGFLPPRTQIVCSATSPLTDAEFKDKLRRSINDTWKPIKMNSALEQYMAGVVCTVQS